MELPLKKIVFEEGDEVNFGIFAVSEVDKPAIGKDFVYLSKEYNTNLSIQNEEKGIVFGPVLIPDIKIYRNQNGEEFNLTVDAPTIERIMVNFFENNRANNVNQNHEDELVNGFTFFQSVITGPLIPTVKGYEDLPIGTAFLGAKVKDKQRIQEIKDGKFKGWSIHAAFRQVPVNLKSQADPKLVEDVLTQFFTRF